MWSSSGKAARAANTFKGPAKIHAGVGKIWRLEENGDKVRLQGSPRRERVVQTVEPPKKRTPAHAVGPSRRAQAKERDSQVIKIPILKQTFLDFTNGKSQLSREELEKYIRASMPERTEIRLSSRDFDWIFAAADRNHDDCIDFSELPLVQAAVESYLGTGKTIRKIFEKHDLNRDGVLEHTELQNLLTELNDFLPVPDEEVEWVMNSTETVFRERLAKAELLNAINLWYNNVDHVADKTAVPKGQKKGGIIGRTMTAMLRDGKSGIKQNPAGKALKSEVPAALVPGKGGNISASEAPLPNLLSPSVGLKIPARDHKGIVK